MSDKISLEFSNDSYECHLNKNVLVLKIKKNAFERLTDLTTRDFFVPWMKMVDESEEVKGLLLITEPGVVNDEKYYAFLKNMAGSMEEKNGRYKISRFDKAEIRAIEINMITNYIKKLLGFRKVVAAGIQGEVVTPFIGLGLAADLRYAKPDMVYSLSHVKYGIHPSGALPFFLPRYIGIGKAAEFLLSGGTITAEEALKLGLINKIIDNPDFEAGCVEAFSKICSVDPAVMKSTKELMYSFNMQFEKFLEKESNYIYK